MEPLIEDYVGFDAQEMVPAKTMDLAFAMGVSKEASGSRKEF